MFEIVDGRTTTDGRRSMGILFIKSSPCEPNGSGELTSHDPFLFGRLERMLVCCAPTCPPKTGPTQNILLPF